MASVLVIYCCVTNYHQNLAATKSTDYLTELRTDLARWSLRVSRRISVKVSVGLEHLLPRWLSHVTSKLMLAVARRPQFFATWVSPEGSS